MTNSHPSELPLQNTRLFPRGMGASCYRLTGIAERCDWSILTDSTKNYVSLRGDFSKPPRTLFLSLRSYFHALPYFYEEVLPNIKNRFVLITGSEDMTVPNQIDSRWRSFNAGEKKLIANIINDERVIHWFAENRDEDRSKMSTLPVGYVFTPDASNSVAFPRPDILVRNRPLKVLCAHRVRKGRQWEVRRKLTQLCNERFQNLSTVFAEEIPEESFQQQVRQHPFVLCAQGGGLDPSPKAWYCIANGSIPIIKSSTLDDAYSQLAVAFVDDWHEDCLSLGQLKAWIEKLAPHYDNDQLRAQMLDRLTLDFWWNKIVEVANSPENN